MKHLLFVILLSTFMFSQKSPTDFFKEYDLDVLHDTSSGFITIKATNISLTESTIQDVSYILTIYQKYVNIFPEVKLNGINWWVSANNVVFDKKWMAFYMESSRSSKMSLIYLKLITDLDIDQTKKLRSSRTYSQQAK